jgi:hypothetical protein
MRFLLSLLGLSISTMTSACAADARSSGATEETAAPAPPQGRWSFEVGRDVMIELRDGSRLPFARALQEDGAASVHDVAAGDTHFDRRGIDLENDRLVVFSSFADGDAEATMIVARPVVRAEWSSPVLEAPAPPQVIAVTLTLCRRKMQWLDRDACTDAKGAVEPAERIVVPGSYEPRRYDRRVNEQPSGWVVGNLTRLFRLRVSADRVAIDVRTSLHWIPSAPGE